MNTASASLTAALRSVVKLSRPAAALLATSWSRPGSKIGTSPCFRRSILPPSLSTQVTDTPNSEKHAPETRPTYPVPIIAIRMGVVSLLSCRSMQARPAHLWGYSRDHRGGELTHPPDVEERGGMRRYPIVWANGSR